MTNKDNKKTERKKIADMTAEEKRAFMQELREESAANEEPKGPLASYEKYHQEQLKKGRVTAIVDADKPGRVQELLEKGYKIDDQSEFKGSKLDRNSTSSQIEVNLGVNSRHNGVVMSTDQDTYDLMMLKRQIEVEQITEGLGHTGISSATGEITIGNKSIKHK